MTVKRDEPFIKRNTESPECSAENRYGALWGIRNLKLLSKNTVNTLFSCYSPKFGECVLKMAKPTAETQAACALLYEYAGAPFCRLYACDRETGEMLLERILPGTRLRELPALEERLRVFCEIYEKLHIAPKDAASYPTYQSLIQRITLYMQDRTDYPELREDMSHAARLTAELSARYPEQMLLHGDLHHDNILLDADGNYRLIDPRGVVGSPVFDIARFVINEFHEEITDDFFVTYQFILAYLSRKLGIPPAVLRELVYVEMCLANCWSVEDGEAPHMAHVRFTREALKA